jgi:hypothetical protein
MGVLIRHAQVFPFIDRVSVIVGYLSTYSHERNYEQDAEAYFHQESLKDV